MTEIDQREYIMSKLEYLKLAHEISGLKNVNDVMAIAKDIENYCESDALDPEEKTLGIGMIAMSFQSFLNDVTIQHPSEGNIGFRPYPHQLITANALANQNRILINKSRQCGMSLFFAAWILWKAMSNEKYNALILSNTFSQSLWTMERIRFIFDSLPVYMKMPCNAEQSKSVFALGNGSVIRAAAASSTFHKQNYDFIYVDEAAYISYSCGENFYSAIKNILSPDGALALVSTGRYDRGLFYDLWTQKNEFKKLEFPWWIMADRDEKWAENQRYYLGERFTNEYECEFMPYKDQ